MAPLLDGSCGGADGSEPVRPTGLYATLVVTGVLMFVATAITFVDVAGVVKIVVLGHCWSRSPSRCGPWFDSYRLAQPRGVLISVSTSHFRR